MKKLFNVKIYYYYRQVDVVHDVYGVLLSLSKKKVKVKVENKVEVKV